MLELSMEDKRRLKRRHLIFYLRIYDTQTNKLLGYLVDITPDGILLMSEHKIETGKLFKLRMDFPSEYSDVQEIEFEAESVWANTDVNPDFHDTGFRIHNISIEERQIIEDIIEDLGFEDID
jgi:hypothetical protein